MFLWKASKVAHFGGEEEEEEEGKESWVKLGRRSWEGRSMRDCSVVNSSSKKRIQSCTHLEFTDIT
jgi:hypothetical protein